MTSVRGGDEYMTGTDRANQKSTGNISDSLGVKYNGICYDSIPGFLRHQIYRSLICDGSKYDIPRFLLHQLYDGVRVELFDTNYMLGTEYVSTEYIIASATG